MSAILAFENPGKPTLRGIEHYWSVILDLDKAGPWSVHDIDLRSNASDRSTIADFVRRLVAAGMAEATGETRVVSSRPSTTPSPLYRLIGRRPQRAPRLRRDGSPASQGRGQQQMWNVMRGPIARDGFTFHDLVLWGSTDVSVISAATARKYVQHLAGAGYLIERRAGRAGQATIWRLKPGMNTGPRPPLILRAKLVYDQNRAKVVGDVVAEEEAP